MTQCFHIFPSDEFLPVTIGIYFFKFRGNCGHIKTGALNQRINGTVCNFLMMGIHLGNNPFLDFFQLLFCKKCYMTAFFNSLICGSPFIHLFFHEYYQRRIRNAFNHRSRFFVCFGKPAGPFRKDDSFLSEKGHGSDAALHFFHINGSSDKTGKIHVSGKIRRSLSENRFHKQIPKINHKIWFIPVQKINFFQRFILDVIFDYVHYYPFTAACVSAFFRSL